MKLAIAAAVALAVACGGRAHLEPGYARSYRGQFAAQRARPPGAKPAVAAPGLDAQEASIIANSYRKSLAPKEERQYGAEPILVVAPPQRTSGHPQLPLPSVPKE
jgi:hypothetical protein